jgi:hypothetical protein
MSDPPSHPGSPPAHERELVLNVVSPRHCVACNACRARFTRVEVACEACGADLAIVGITIMPLRGSGELFDASSQPPREQSSRRLGVAFGRFARLRRASP